MDGELIAELSKIEVKVSANREDVQLDIDAVSYTHLPISSIDYDKRTRRAKVEISLCGELKTLTLSTEGGEDEDESS